MKTGCAHKADQLLFSVSSFESWHAHEGEDAIEADVESRQVAGLQDDDTSCARSGSGQVQLDICSLRPKPGSSRVESMGSLFLLPGTGQGDLGSSEKAQESAEAVEKGCNESDLIAPGDKGEMAPPPHHGAEVEDACQHEQGGCEGDDEDAAME